MVYFLLLFAWYFIEELDVLGRRVWITVLVFFGLLFNLLRL